MLVCLRLRIVNRKRGRAGMSSHASSRANGVHEEILVIARGFPHRETSETIVDDELSLGS